MMRVGIRTKLMGIVAGAVVLPLALGLSSLFWLGHRLQVRQQGRLFETMAVHLAGSLGRLVDDQVAKLHDWVQLSEIDILARTLRATALGTDQIHDLDRRWPHLVADDADLHAVLENPLAERLHAFRSLNANFSELLITDAKGRLIAASNKTTDYWQADEEWWTRAAAMNTGEAWVEGIHLDASAGVMSLDIALPIRADRGGALVGVVKGVLDASPLLASLRPAQPDLEAHRDVVLPDGRILAPLFRKAGSPEVLSPDEFRPLRAGRSGSALVRGPDGRKEIEGYAQIIPGGWTRAPHRINITGLTPLFVVVHEDAAKVLGPVHAQMERLAGGGAALLLLFGLGCFVAADRLILRPLRRIQRAAGAVAADAASRERGEAALEEAQRVRQDLAALRTGDEFETLAADFNRMAARVLNYHQQLEEEIARKTEEIQSDLVLAREFQQALLPARYPDVRAPGAAGGLVLRFSHVYKPAQSVGGDFFHTDKLSDHEAAVFIADVAGHGARAALVTAMLRTLLNDMAPYAREPAALMDALNREFISLMPKGDECIFATAFHLVLDLERGTACFASAGHPAGLVLDRRSGAVTPLTPGAASGPALGLDAASRYTQSTRPLREGELLLLLTDGVLEALSPQGEEYGAERVAACIERHRGGDAHAIVNAVVADVDRHLDTAVETDDVCLVGIEVSAGAPGPADQR